MSEITDDTKFCSGCGLEQPLKNDECRACGLTAFQVGPPNAPAGDEEAPSSESDDGEGEEDAGEEEEDAGEGD